MTHDEIIRQNEVLEMARQAGIVAFGDVHLTFEELEAFAKLVEERTAAREREACAKVCESLFDLEDDTCNEAEKCAAAIRARGQT